MLGLFSQRCFYVNGLSDRLFGAVFRTTKYVFQNLFDQLCVIVEFLRQKTFPDFHFAQFCLEIFQRLQILQNSAFVLVGIVLQSVVLHRRCPQVPAEIGRQREIVVVQFLHLQGADVQLF